MTTHAENIKYLHVYGLSRNIYYFVYEGYILTYQKIDDYLKHKNTLHALSYKPFIQVDLDSRW